MSEIKSGQVWQGKYASEFFLTVNHVGKNFQGKDTVFATVHATETDKESNVEYDMTQFESYWQLTDVKPEQTFCQLLLAGNNPDGSLNAVYAEYNSTGELRAVYKSSTHHTPVHLYNAIQLPAISVNKSFLVGFIYSAQ